MSFVFHNNSECIKRQKSFKLPYICALKYATNNIKNSYYLFVIQFAS